MLLKYIQDSEFCMKNNNTNQFMFDRCKKIIKQLVIKMFAMPILLQIECDAVQPLLPYYKGFGSLLHNCVQRCQNHENNVKITCKM